MKIGYHRWNHIKRFDQPTWKPIRASQCFVLRAYFIAAIASEDTPSRDPKLLAGISLSSNLNDLFRGEPTYRLAKYHPSL